MTDHNSRETVLQ